MQWQEVLADKSLQDLPYKIELNEKGNIEMSPASFIHSYIQGEIAYILRSKLDGYVLTELAIQTSKGIKVPDVAWGDASFFQKHRGDLFSTSAPQLCVEILSPSNTKSEMLEKVTLYLDSGAEEVWLVEEKGGISIYDYDGEKSKSKFIIDINTILLFH